jgi:cytidyltransferase-like protein
MDSETIPDSPTAPGSDPSTYPVVALGGTFDHLHAGHKILLSMAAWIADEKVIVGVTGMWYGRWRQDLFNYGTNAQMTRS